MNEWISVKDKKPEENIWILLGCSKYDMTTWGIFVEDKFFNPDQDYLELPFITHWMPLPKPPGE